MLIRRKFDKVVMVAVGVGILVYASTRPKLRLRSEMPLEFVDAPRSWPAEKREPEKTVARAYWNCAVTVIQWKYGFGSRLPPAPPQEFRIMAPDQREGATDADARLRYWRKLQQIWYLPSYWRKDYGRNLRWLTDPLKSAAKWLRDYVERFFRPGSSAISLRGAVLGALPSQLERRSVSARATFF